MSAPTVTGWPGLGFDPVPGDAARVGELRRRLLDVATVLGVAHDGLSDVRRGRGVWEGRGADAFTETFGPLPRYLDAAAQSLTRATTVLGRWHSYLAEQQRVAAGLEADARAALQRVEQGRTAHNAAARHPDVAFAGQQVPVEMLQRVTDAVRQLDEARRVLGQATDTLEALRARGRQMLGDHEREAHDVAGRLRRADDGLAPPEPGFFDRAMTWIGDHLDDIGDVAGTIAAVAGALALFPPLTAVAGPVALLAGGVALAADVADTAVHDQWRNPEQWKKIGLDAVGLVPGVRAGVGIVTAMRNGDEIGSIAARIGDEFAKPTFTTKAQVWMDGLPALINRHVTPALQPVVLDGVRRIYEADKRLDRAGERWNDVGRPREGANDWGRGAFTDAVRDTADGLRDGVRTAGDIARDVLPDVADGVISSAGDAVIRAIDDAQGHAERAVDAGADTLDSLGDVEVKVDPGAVADAATGPMVVEPAPDPAGPGDAAAGGAGGPDRIADAATGPMVVEPAPDPAGPSAGASPTVDGAGDGGAGRSGGSGDLDGGAAPAYGDSGAGASSDDGPAAEEADGPRGADGAGAASAGAGSGAGPSGAEVGGGREAGGPEGPGERGEDGPSSGSPGAALAGGGDAGPEGCAPGGQDRGHADAPPGAGGPSVSDAAGPAVDTTPAGSSGTPPAGPVETGPRGAEGVTDSAGTTVGDPGATGPRSDGQGSGDAPCSCECCAGGGSHTGDSASGGGEVSVEIAPGDADPGDRTDHRDERDGDGNGSPRDGSGGRDGDANGAEHRAGSGAAPAPRPDVAATPPAGSTDVRPGAVPSAPARDDEPRRRDDPDAPGDRRRRAAGAF